MIEFCISLIIKALSLIDGTEGAKLWGFGGLGAMLVPNAHKLRHVKENQLLTLRVLKILLIKAKCIISVWIDAT